MRGPLSFPSGMQTGPLIEICQLIPGTLDGFPKEIFYILEEQGPDPPFLETYDPSHADDYCDPPHGID
jgi:hypothetical protein